MTRKNQTVGYRALAAMLMLASSGACNRTEPEEPPGAPNVLMILIDTLRADKLGCYGNDLGLTPNLDDFAEESVLFERAFSHAPWTLPSVASLMTSTHPARHGAGHQRVRGLPFTRLRPRVRTLAECFGDQGYDTAAFVNVLFLSPKFGVNRGFQLYNFKPPRQNQGERRADEVTDLALDWIRSRQEQGDRPFFLLAHYFDPHLTYDPPAAFRQRFAGPLDQEQASPLFGTEGDMIRFRAGRTKIASIPVKRLERLYNGEIAYTDQQIGRLLDAVDAMGLRESTLVLVTADHGEEFLDHGGFEHGHTLYDELIHVPLMIRYPDEIPPGIIKTTVRQIDIAPTLCDLIDLEPEPTFVGRSLVPMIYGEHTGDRPVLSQGNMWGPWLTSWRHDGYKLIKRQDRSELYHVETDPAEVVDLAADPSRSDRRDRMAAELETALKAAKSAGPGQGSAVPLTPDERKRFQALGYVGEDQAGDDTAKPHASSQPATRPASPPVPSAEAAERSG